MNLRFYRILRAVAGLISLAAGILAFADIGDWVSAFGARVILWPQFTPSLLDMAGKAAWIAGGCVAVIVLTLLFGRVYCAMLCPLGVLMDVAALLAKRTGRLRKLPFAEGRPWLRASAVAVSTAGLLLGTAVPLGLLDPYSVFGRIVAGTVRPLCMWANHGLAALGWAHPVVVSPVHWATALVAVGMLCLIVWLAIRRGRLWCNTACPVGAVLGFFSRFAWLRLRIASSQCVACSMCERVCPAQCIDFRNHQIDHSRCVMCLDCVSSCRRNGISFVRGGKLVAPAERQGGSSRRAATCERVESSIPGILPLRRRGFLALAASVPVVALAESDAKKDLDQHNKRVVLPPGARGINHFRRHCTACHLCVVNCPDQVLRPSITRHGLSGFLQPYQDFDVAFCSYNCSNCSQICPTGAIQPISVEERQGVQAGLVRLFEDRCVVHTAGTSCGACAEHCPTQAVHMVPFKGNLTAPEITPELCVGCGGCEFICPVRPSKAIIVEGLELHGTAKKPDRGKANTVRKMDEQFPF
jgi:ferredoxin